MRWDQGRAAIERMLTDSELQRVLVSREQADRLIAQAQPASRAIAANWQAAAAQT
jgi:hypothetical protein